MKVLFITRKYPPSRGGMETFSYNLIKKTKLNKKVIKYGGSQKWLPFVIPYFCIKAVWEARNVDMVHLGDMVLCVVGIWIRLFYPSKIIVANVHGLDVTYPLFLYRLYVRILGQGFDKYVCNSKETEIEAKKVRLNNTEVVPMGIDVSEWKTGSDRAEIDRMIGEMELKEKVTLLTVGRLVKRKGVAWFLENVFVKLPEKFSYLIIGKGREKKKIEGLIVNLGLKDKVKILSDLSLVQLKGLYQEADIFVMPNIVVKGDMEGFGIVAIEAGAAAMPVVASGIEGIKDAVIDGKNGFLIRQKDAEGFLRKILELGDDTKDNRDKLGEQFREYNKRFDWTNIVRQYETIFKQVNERSV